MANIAGLLKIHTCPIREFWSNLTKTTTRRWLSDNIGALKTRIQRLQSSDLNMRDLIESISAEEFKIQVAISAGLTCPIRELWSNLTKTTTRRDLSDNIVALKAQLKRLKNDELSIIQLIESISVNDEDAVR